MRRIYSMGLCAICFILVGCSGSGQNDEVNVFEKSSPKVQEENYTFPEKYEKIIDGVTFDTNIIIDSESMDLQFYQGEAKLQNISYDKLPDLLFGDLDNINKTSDKATNYFGEKYEDVYYTDTEQNMLNIGYNYAYFATPFYYYIPAAFRISGDCNLEKYSTESEHQEFRREKAREELLEILKKIGIAVEKDDVLCYTLDHETLAAEEYMEDMDGNEDIEEEKVDWSEEDDSYYFFINQKYHGLPTYHEYVYNGAEGDSLDASPIQAVYSRRGLEMLTIERVFEFEDTVQNIQLAPFDKVAESIAYRFTRVISNDKFIVKEAKLKYMERLTGEELYEIAPVWIVSFEMQSEGSDVRTLQMLCDAVSGEEIIK